MKHLKYILLALLALTLISPAYADYKEFKKDDIEVYINTTSPSIFFEYNTTEKYAEVIDPNIKEAKIKYKAVLADLKPPVAIPKLTYRNKPDKKYKESKPYKKNGKYYEVPELIYDENKSQYYWVFWTEHLTDFYVNSTNMTLQECWQTINNSAITDRCIINEAGWTETFNTSETYNFVGDDTPVQAVADNLTLDFNFSTTTNSRNFYVSAAANMKNILLQNINIIGGGIEFNPSSSVDNGTIINASIINRTSGAASIVLKGKEFNVHNTNIIGGSTSDGLLIWATVDNASFNLSDLKIIDYVNQGDCIELIEGVFITTFVRLDNVLIENGCHEQHAIDLDYFRPIYEVTLNNVVVNNTGVEGNTGAGIVINGGATNPNVTITNSTFINYAVFSAWRTDPITATYNSLTYNTNILLDDTGFGNTAVTVFNQNVNGGTNGRPDGTKNYSFWLINGAAADYTILVEDGGSNTCAAVAGAVGGTCDLEVDHILISNGANTDYTIGNTLPAGVSLVNQPRIDYSTGADQDLIVIGADTLIFTNNTLYNEGSFVKQGLNVTGLANTANIVDNSFLNVNGSFLTEIGFTFDNFWSNTSGRDPPSSDVGSIILASYEAQPVFSCIRNQTFTPKHKANNDTGYNWTILGTNNITLFSTITDECLINIPVAYQNESNIIRVQPFIKSNLVGEKIWGIEASDGTLDWAMAVLLIIGSISIFLLLFFEWFEGEVILPVRILFLFCGILGLVLTSALTSNIYGLLSSGTDGVLLLDRFLMIVEYSFIIMLAFFVIYFIFYAIRSWQQENNKSIFD